MTMLNKISLFLATACMCAPLFISGCGSPVIVSEYRSSAITIDGNYTDWGNARTYYDEKEKVILNLLNDKDYLYICLVTRNLDIEYRLMESGLSLWFDDSGKKDKHFGVRYPIGMRTMGMPIEDEEKGPREWRGEGDREYERELEKQDDRDAAFEKKLEALEGLQYKLRLLKKPLDKKKSPGYREGDITPKEKPDDRFLEDAANLGIEARIGRQNGYFVYELKVPLAKSARQPLAIGAKAGDTISLGVEIGGEMPEGEKALRLWLTVMLSQGGAQ